jgi:TonB family protein
VVPVRDSKAPRYPNAMRADAISGCVIAQFVVDEEGRADTTTFRALRYTRPEFVEAVRAALPSWRFQPAQRQGKTFGRWSSSHSISRS